MRPMSAFTLYQMKRENGKWTDPLVAPLQGSDSTGLPSCLSFEPGRAFFTASRPTYPPCDIWMSTRGDSAWTEPKNLGAPINSEHWDIYPSISPVGKYLFFARGEAWRTAEDSDIYWVSAGFIDRLRPATGR